MNNLLRGVIVGVAIMFLSLNFYLLYGDKSVIRESFYVTDYDRVITADYEELLAKKSFLTARETHTVSIKEGNDIESWLVKAGDQVTLGQELAVMNVEEFEEERIIWEYEREALLDQESTLEILKSELETLRDRSSASSHPSTNTGSNQYVTEVDGNTIIELGMTIGMQIDVTQEGSYTQAIVAVEQQLSDIERQLKVLAIKLDQDGTRPALISPVDGFVSHIQKQGPHIFVDIFEEEQLVTTFVHEADWHDLEEGQGVEFSSEHLPEDLAGSIEFVSPVPASPSELLTAYEELIAPIEEATAYYEVRMALDDQVDMMPFQSTMMAHITIDEALDAAAIPKEWGIVDSKERLAITKLQANGKPTILQVENPFDYTKVKIVAEGLEEGDVIIHHPLIYGLPYEPRIYMPMPMEIPTIEEWKAFGFKHYIKAMLWK